MSATTGGVINKGLDNAVFEGHVESNAFGVLEMKASYFVRETGGIVVYDPKLIKEHSSRWMASIGEDGTIHCDVTDLKPKTEYQYVVCVSVRDKEFFGVVKWFTTNMNPCPDDHHLHAIDLGLSVKWACCNVGASKPEEYGNHFAWAETEPKDWYGDWMTYKWSGFWGPHFTRYCPSDEPTMWEGTGSPDNKTEFKDYDYVDDAARVKLGGNWRTPTVAEWEELCNHCTWIWTSDYNETGIAGIVVTGKKEGYTNNSIFLPAAGERYKFDIDGVGTYGAYYSSSLYVERPQFAWGFGFNSKQIWCATVLRYVGHSIRPVTD